MATTYSMPTDETLKRVASALETQNGLLQRVSGGYVLFTSTKPAESSVTTRPCLVIVTTTGEMYLVADDLQAAAKANAWPDEEEESKQNFSWSDEEEDDPSTVAVNESKAGTTGQATDTTTDAATDENDVITDANADTVTDVTGTATSNSETVETSEAAADTGAKSTESTDAKTE